MKDNKVNVKSFSENHHTEEPQSSGYHSTQQNKQKLAKVEKHRPVKGFPLSARKNFNCKTLQEHQENVINSINLSGLQTEEIAQSRQLLAEFSDVFTTNENNVDNVQDFHMKLNLKFKSLCSGQL